MTDTKRNLNVALRYAIMVIGAYKAEFHIAERTEDDEYRRVWDDLTRMLDGENPFEDEWTLERFKAEMQKRKTTEELAHGRR